MVADRKRLGVALAFFLSGAAPYVHGEEGKMMRYTVKRVEAGALEAVDFSRAEVGRVSNLRPESSAHAPETSFRVLHDGTNLYVRFDVRDRYVRSVQTAYQAPVCTDSCVEFFVQPKAGKGYFNFEVNAGGTLLLYYVEDPARTPQGLAKFTPVAEQWGRLVEIRSSLPRVVDPEIAEPVTWQVRYKVPLAVLEAYVGEVGRDGAVWRANFYKCGDKTSHPHWLSWSPVSALNFHLPACFGELVLDALPELPAGQP
jgi:hypothetical protein